MRSTCGAALLLFVLLASLYSFSIELPASRSASITGDEPFYLLTTQSLLQDGNLDLREQYASESYRSFFDHADGLWMQSAPLEDGRILSPHQPGLSVLLLPGFAIGGLLGAQVQLLLIAAATFGLSFLFAARETGHPWIAWVVAAVVGLSAPAFVYATEVYPEMPAAACVVLALFALRDLRGMTRCLALIGLVSALAWLGMKYVPLGLILAVAYLLREREWRMRSWFVGLGALSGLAYVAAHLAWFGALTPYNSNLVYDGASTATVVASHLGFEERIYRLWGLFVDQRFGIGRWAPVFLAIWPALPLLWRAGQEGRLVLGLIVAQLAVATFLAITMMGWWFPGRMLIAVFPLFVLVLTLAAARLPKVALVLAGLVALYSIAVTAVLVEAARSGIVRIAVDPFTMPSPVFQATERFFPNYTWWGSETVMLNAVWAGAGILAIALVTWRTARQKAERRRLAFWPPRSSTI